MARKKEYEKKIVKLILLKEGVYDLEDDLTITYPISIHAMMMKYSPELHLEGIHQFFIDVEREEWKLDTLCDLYETVAIKQAIIYCNTRRKVDWLTEQMSSRDFTVSVVHGDMDKRQRALIIREFRSGSSRVLVTTGLLARCIDVRRARQVVTLVINYDIPTNRENYIYRVGHSGHFGFGKCGAINFRVASDVRYLRDIEEFYHTQIEEMPMDVADLQMIFMEN